MADKKVKKEETKIETEETGVQFGYVYQGKLVDLVPHSDARKISRFSSTFRC